MSINHIFSHLLVACFLSVASSLSATNRYVAVGGTGNGLSWRQAQGNIAAAVRASGAGDTVFVAAGLYRESVLLRDGVTLMGGYRLATGMRSIERFRTILDGTSLGQPLLYAQADCQWPTLVDGFTIQNASVAGQGGGVYLRANCLLAHCCVAHCQAVTGGGIYNNGGVVRNCLVELCSATDAAGAVYNVGGLVEKCMIRGNSGKFGAIVNRAYGLIDNCVVHNNDASVPEWPNCGGIYNPEGTVRRCIVASNRGSQYAAMHSDGCVQNTICWNNHAEEGFPDPVAYVADTSKLSGNNAADDGFERACDALRLNVANDAPNGPHFKAPTFFAGVPTTAAERLAMRTADWTLEASSPCLILRNNDSVNQVKQPFVKVTHLRTANQKLTLCEGQSAWLSVAIEPQHASCKKISWISADTTIAVVANGQVAARSVGRTQVQAVAADGKHIIRFHVRVLAKLMTRVHRQVQAADSLCAAYYTVPSYTQMLIAKEAARADSSEANLLALARAVDALVDRRMPYCVVANVNGDPARRMAFAWFTNEGITDGRVQLLPQSHATAVDFAHAVEFVANVQQADSLPYAVSTSGVLKAAHLPVETTHNYVSHKVVAEHLQPSTTYSYRVGLPGYWSRIGTFTTAPDSTQAFSFLYMTDTHVMNAEYVEQAALAAKAAAALAPDARFLLFPGDFVETGGRQNSEWEWEQWFETAMAPLLCIMPLVPTDGNHDDTENQNYTLHFNTDSSFNATASVCPQFAGINYSFVYGNALFLIYSHQDYWRGKYNYDTGYSTYLEDVKAWMRTQVATHPSTKWRIVAVHKNLFTGSGHQADADAVLFRAAMLPLFAELHIDFAIQGHDHIYEVIGPVDNLTKTPVVNAVSAISASVPDSLHNPLGRQGGIFDVSRGTLYFVNGTAGRKRYMPYTQARMDDNKAATHVPDYWHLFTGKYGQPDAPAFSRIVVNSDAIEVHTYTANIDGGSTLFDMFRIVKKE